MASALYGYHLYGKVDQVPGKFFVATLFLHVTFMPVLPKKSYLVRVGDEGVLSFSGIAIPFSWKSVAYAYLRFLLVIFLLLFFGGVTESPWSFSDPKTARMGYFYIGGMILSFGLFL